MSPAQIYFLGIGSNIDPAVNFKLAIQHLQKEFDHLVLWPVVQTLPVDFVSQNLFYNTLIVIQSDWPQHKLKAWCNQLEVMAGRDRGHPLSAQRDRPLDIDILAQQNQLNLAVLQQFTEPYVQDVVRSEWSSALISLQVSGHVLGKRPTAIYTDHASGHIMVIEDSVDRLLQSFKTTLHCEQSLS